MANDPAVDAWYGVAQEPLQHLGFALRMFGEVIGKAFELGELNAEGRIALTFAANNIGNEVARCRALPPAPDAELKRLLEEALARFTDTAAAVIAPKFAASYTDLADAKAAAAHITEGSNAYQAIFARLREL